jgi:hypothetical protein
LVTRIQFGKKIKKPGLTKIIKLKFINIKMNFKKYSNKEKNKTVSIFEFKFKNKTYKIPFEGENRRIKSFEFLLKSYPDFFNVHDEEITKIYKDSNKAINEFIIQEGFQGFVLEEKKNASNDEKVNFFKLDLDKICQHLDTLQLIILAL